MAQLTVRAGADQPGTCEAEIKHDDEQGTYATAACGEFIYHRGHFEDTVEEAAKHVDTCRRTP